MNGPFLCGTGRESGAEPQSAVSVPNIRGLNPISLRRAYDEKAYVLLVAIHLSDENVKLDGPFGAFRKE